MSKRLSRVGNRRYAVSRLDLDQRDEKNLTEQGLSRAAPTHPREPFSTTRPRRDLIGGRVSTHKAIAELVAHHRRNRSNRKTEPRE